MSTTFHSRAKKGGELGANGEWYEGGKFIATTEHPKRFGSRKPALRKQEIEPYKWEVGGEGQVAIFPQLAGVELFDRRSGKFSLNPGLRMEYLTESGLARRQSLIARYNAGERWA